MKQLKLILLLFLPFWAGATHLVGGIIELKWLGGDSYNLTVHIIRDCENGSPNAYFDGTIAVGIFEKVTHIKKAQFNLAFSKINDDTLKLTGTNCANIITGCTHIGTYSQNIILNSNTYNSNNGYYLSWQRCCRNGIINNIINPGDASMTLYTEVPNLKTVKNSTPRYTNNPNTLLCVNNLFQYNLGFVDDDGDELKYSLIDPINGLLDRNNPFSPTAFAGPYPNVVYRNGFSNAGPIDGTVPMNIDPVTGLLSCNPSSPGIYVASIRVEEYRFGVKIGEARLELQFTVTVCPNNPPIASVLTINDQILLVDTVEIQIPEKACFKIRGIDPSDSLYMRITSDSIDTIFQNHPIYDTLSVGYKFVETTICWQSDCQLEKLGKSVPFYVFVTDNGCPLPRNATSKFWVKFIPMPLVNSTDLLCMTLLNKEETFVYFGDSTDPNDPSFDKYLIFRGINYQNFEVIDTIYDKKQRLFHDPNTPDYDVINYTYFMRGVNKCGNLGPTSDTLSTFEQLEFIPQKQCLKYVTVVDNDHLELEWPASLEKDFAKYFLYKGIYGQNKFDQIGVFENVNDIKYTDRAVNVMDTSYCYHLVMKDTCDNIGPVGYISCSIVLTGKALKYMSNLKYQSYTGWREGTKEYQIFRSDPSNPFTQIGKQDTAGTYLDDKLNFNEGLFYYYVIAKQAFDQNIAPFFDAESQSNTISLYQPPIVYAPNAFTANGDGLNDEFKWVPVFVKDFHIDIYNRWGQLVFKTDNKNEPWDGKVNGQASQEDVYFYILNYTGWDGSNKTQSGNFTLLR
ncbi:MAG: gliding motility-associated C-terminal domain-containing protein [Bacteroidia bacterium]|nr:gliding motility-associated C-terminal domain-containing protein [Bacteroidia bacterium]